MASKSKSKQEEALQLLDDLDSFTPLPEDSVPPTNSGSAAVLTPTGTNEGEAEALAFIDEITQKSAEPTRSIANLDKPPRSTTPSLRKSTERVKLGGGSGRATPAPASSSSDSKGKAPETTTSADSASTPTPSASGSGWGWGSVWSTASAALQQARTAVDEQVKNLPQNEQAKRWREGVLEYAKSAQLEKLGQDFKRVGLSTLTDILNVVAPPISEHEIIHVWLSHDMLGYDGVESLVYKALARILEQVEGGDLVVNQGESRLKDSAKTDGRELNAVEGYDAAVKLAKANLEELIKTKEADETNGPAPGSVVTYSYVYLRIQPYFSSVSTSSEKEASSLRNLQFLLHFADPNHNLVHSTVSQAIPETWLPLWDSYEWVEDLVAEAMRLSVEVIGQEYVVARMGWASTGAAKAVSESFSKSEQVASSPDARAEDDS